MLNKATKDIQSVPVKKKTVLLILSQLRIRLILSHFINHWICTLRLVPCLSLSLSDICRYVKILTGPLFPVCVSMWAFRRFFFQVGYFPLYSAGSFTCAMIFPFFIFLFSCSVLFFIIFPPSIIFSLFFNYRLLHSQGFPFLFLFFVVCYFLSLSPNFNYCVIYFYGSCQIQLSARSVQQLLDPGVPRFVFLFVCFLIVSDAWRFFVSVCRCISAHMGFLCPFCCSGL